MLRRSADLGIWVRLTCASVRSTLLLTFSIIAQNVGNCVGQGCTFRQCRLPQPLWWMRLSTSSFGLPLGVFLAAGGVHPDTSLKHDIPLSFADQLANTLRYIGYRRGTVHMSDLLIFRGLLDFVHRAPCITMNTDSLVRIVTLAVSSLFFNAGTTPPTPSASDEEQNKYRKGDKSADTMYWSVDTMVKGMRVNIVFYGVLNSYTHMLLTAFVPLVDGGRDRFLRSRQTASAGPRTSHLPRRRIVRPMGAWRRSDQRLSLARVRSRRSARVRRRTVAAGVLPTTRQALQVSAVGARRPQAHHHWSLRLRSPPVVHRRCYDGVW